MSLFDPEDENQERELAKLLYRRRRPSDSSPLGALYEKLDGHKRVARLHKHEIEWSAFHVSMIEEMTRGDDGFDFESMLIREILALLPYAVKKEVLRTLASADGRRIRTAGRLIRESQPELVARLAEALVL